MISMNSTSTLLLLVLLICIYKVNTSCSPCYNGIYDEDLKCQCLPGWTGPHCQYCGGRVRVNGTSGSIVSQFGREYKDFSKCMWYLETDQQDVDIHIKFELLDTECGWDYLYIFDGDSLHSRKLAAFSGPILSPKVLEPNTTSSIALECTLPEYKMDQSFVLALQDSALLYFYTDAGYEAKGFNFTYWTDCGHNCSGHGVCDNRTRCVCDVGWTGTLCEEELCSNNCSSNGVCDPVTKTCTCEERYTGPECGTDLLLTHWETLAYEFKTVVFLENASIAMVGLELGMDSLRRAGHSAVLWDGFMWVYGGYTFPVGSNEMKMESSLWSYHLVNKTWNAYLFLEDNPAVATPSQPDTASNTTFGNSSVFSNTSSPPVEPVPTNPSPRYGHSAVVYEGVMYIYGGELEDGTISNQLWALNLTTLSWELIVGNSSVGSLPLGVRQHTAHVVDGVMYVFWGYPSERITIPTRIVQQYDFAMGVWSASEQRGPVLNGSFGHSSVYSEDTGLIYLFGSNRGQHVMASYNPSYGEWSVLPSVGVPLAHHSATLVGSSIVVYGGRSTGTNSQTKGACYRDDVLVYDIACRKWYNATELAVSVEGLSTTGRHRYAHTAIPTPDDAVLMFGGFNGLLLSDVAVLHLPNCTAFTTAGDCADETLLGLCAWSDTAGQCLRSTFLLPSCPVDSCLAYTNCSSCADVDGCQWLSSSSEMKCTSHNSTANVTSRVVRDPGLCSSFADRCSRYSSCEDCTTAGCFSRGSSCSLERVNFSTSNILSCGSGDPCSSHRTCGTCNTPSCLWCPSLQRCMPSHNGAQYPASYPFGQCLGWAKDNCPEESCSSYIMCGTCTADPRCGWCYDEGQTGIGVCKPGGFNSDSGAQCDSRLWYFDDCPLCQCNGHSTCENGSSECVNCTDNTTGDMCQYCVDGWYGNPVNNASMCTECFCNGLADTCNNRTGVCDCYERGVAGQTCDRCEASVSYTRTNPLEEFCAYRVSVGEADQIRNVVINISNNASYFLIIPGSDNDVAVNVFIINPNQNTSLSYVLLHGRVSGGLLNRSASPFQVDAGVLNVFDPSISYTVQQGEFGDRDVAMLLKIFKTGEDFTISMSFTIQRGDDILIAFVVFTGTFVVCLTVMLGVLAIFWYGFKYYDRRRRIRRHRREMRRRVARPFATVKALVHEKTGLDHQQQVGYVGVEPLENAKAAVVSVIVQLPCDPETGKPRKEQTGICFGSALVKIKPKQNSTLEPKKKGLFQRKKKVPISQETNRNRPEATTSM